MFRRLTVVTHGKSSLSCMWKQLLSSISSEANSVLEYWFDPSLPTEMKMKRWFSNEQQQDTELKTKFGDLVQRARNGELKQWDDDHKSALAHIVLLDQFCRSIYRGRPESFSHDHMALSIANKIVLAEDKKYKQTLDSLERTFLYLPFEHSEDLDIQVLSVKLFQELSEETEGQDNHHIVKNFVVYAQQHLEVIKKFGRFPKRNAVLGRANTEEEEEFLASNKYNF